MKPQQEIIDVDYVDVTPIMLPHGKVHNEFDVNKQLNAHEPPNEISLSTALLWVFVSAVLMFTAIVGGLTFNIWRP